MRVSILIVALALTASSLSLFGVANAEVEHYKKYEIGYVKQEGRVDGLAVRLNTPHYRWDKFSASYGYACSRSEDSIPQNRMIFWTEREIGAPDRRAADHGVYETTVELFKHIPKWGGFAHTVEEETYNVELLNPDGTDVLVWDQDPEFLYDYNHMKVVFPIEGDNKATLLLHDLKKVVSRVDRW